MAKQRLDMLLVERGLCPTRQQAQQVIRAGEVKVNQVVVDKPGTPIPTDADLEVKQKSPYVSRGGESWSGHCQNSPFTLPVELPWTAVFPQAGLLIACCSQG
jgi:predicted rRNA methylase YqxC with S4 and FtsJ domains